MYSKNHIFSCEHITFHLINIILKFSVASILLFNYSKNSYFQLRAYYLAEFGRKLKLELHCITSQVTIRKYYKSLFFGKYYDSLFIGKYYKSLFIGKYYKSPFIGRKYYDRDNHFIFHQAGSDSNASRVVALIDK